MSINAGMLASYDQAKEVISKHVFHEDISKPSIPTQILSSLVSGFCATACSLPFDLLKSRLQDGGIYSGVMDAATQILKKEGKKNY
jgi:solute carrier family 25 oxoglutarate transporter 11